MRVVVAPLRTQAERDHRGVFWWRSARGVEFDLGFMLVYSLLILQHAVEWMDEGFWHGKMAYRRLV
jgi:hypothetical protein